MPVGSEIGSGFRRFDPDPMCCLSSFRVQSGFLLSGLFSSEGMEQVFVWPSCYNHQLFSFQEALDWRFLVPSDFLVGSFVNCT
ncbi:hypothetical protein HID58_095521 [Brassica napus]|uniref:Uncharacterized protein n=1 Tax=Brassica napus TaxID=3708 RepID=A0ABQ7X3F8_BRANA|nr:hypothetical protein HID58_095521 [Brassica napus]